jgi:hypothetical protein
MRADVWRETGIGKEARVVELGDVQRTHSWAFSRVLQLAAVGVAAFAVGWILSPLGGSSPEDSPTTTLAQATVPENPRPVTLAPVDVDLGPGRISPSVPSEGVPVLVSSDPAANGPGRRVVIRDSSATPESEPLTSGVTVATDLLRALRTQPNLAIPPEAVLASVETLLGENPTAGDEASLRYLKAEILLLEREERTSAALEYESVIRLTNDQGPLAERARSRLASLR